MNCVMHYYIVLLLSEFKGIQILIIICNRRLQLAIVFIESIYHDDKLFIVFFVKMELGYKPIVDNIGLYNVHRYNDFAI